MIVMKFGGSSVDGAQRIRHVANIIKAHAALRPVVVVSAMGDTTDRLLEAADAALKGEYTTSRHSQCTAFRHFQCTTHSSIAAGGTEQSRAEQSWTERIAQFHRETAEELSLPDEAKAEVERLLAELDRLLTGVSMVWELTKRTKDYLVSFGERLSSRIVSAYLETQGIHSVALDAWDAGITSDSNYGAAEPLEGTWKNIRAALLPLLDGEKSVVPVITGFIAKDKAGVITTLGRGGSDLTATLLGAALKASEIQTWKDVDGILTSDPHICPDARPVSEVTYEEAQELAMFGAQVLHPRSMVPCRKAGVPVRVKNSYNIKSPGTLIVEKRSGNAPPVVAVTAVRHITLIDIVSTRMLGAAGFLAHIFNQFLKWNVSIDVIATSEVSVSLTVAQSDGLEGLLEDVGRVAEVKAHSGKAIVSVICDASHSSAILNKAFAALEAEGINVQMISQGASKVNISVLVDDGEADGTVRALHSAFFGGGTA